MRAAIYTRVSTREQSVEGISLDMQLDRGRKYCKHKGWDIAQEYVDPAVSGTTLERPAYKRLLRDIEAGEIEALVVYKFDRLTRSARYFMDLMEDLKQRGIALVSIKEDVDTSTATGKLFIRMLAIFSEFEVDLIKERTHDGMDKKAADGYVQYRAPYGYRLVDGELIIEPAEAKVVRMIYAMRKEDTSLQAIADEHQDLNPTKVWRILRNPVYRGKIRWKKKTLKGTHEPIITTGARR